MPTYDAAVVKATAAVKDVLAGLLGPAGVLLDTPLGDIITALISHFISGFLDFLGFEPARPNAPDGTFWGWGLIRCRGDVPGAGAGKKVKLANDILYQSLEGAPKFGDHAVGIPLGRWDDDEVVPFASISRDGIPSFQSADCGRWIFPPRLSHPAKTDKGYTGKEVGGGNPKTWFWFRDNQRPRPGAAEALRRAQAAGDAIFLASGRKLTPYGRRSNRHPTIIPLPLAIAGAIGSVWGIPGLAGLALAGGALVAGVTPGPRTHRPPPGPRAPGGTRPGRGRGR